MFIERATRRLACQICGDATGTTYQAPERMFGLGGCFTYLECSGCGCVQQLSPPADLTPYYPPNYYSFQEEEPADFLPGGWRLRIFRARNQAQFFGGVLRPVVKWKERPDFAWVVPLFQHTGIRRLDARILDVGCGLGLLLKRLRQAGFSRLVGCDPFLPEPITQGSELIIHACAIDQLLPDERSRFDLIMFHHSLEHIADPIGPLMAAEALLAPNGVCLIGTPVSSSEAWQTYRADWVELDPPRHFFLHTHRSLTMAARQAGLRVERIQQDGGPLEFWGSELYRRGLTLMTSEGRFRTPADVFSAEEMQSFAERSARANAAGAGGRALFYCTKA
jgi:SAM-dependent methyltransferase